MESLKDISVNLPVELLDSLSEVIKVGLQRAKIPPEDRKSLSSWWEAEHEIVQSYLPKNNYGT